MGLTVYGGGENVTSEVTAQTQVISEIANNLGLEITIPSGSNKQILQGNNSNLLKIKVKTKYYPNGREWTQGFVSSNYFNVLCYGNGIFVANSYSSGVYFSSDGKTWTQSASGLKYAEDIVYGNGKFYAVKSDGIYCSADGSVWTSVFSYNFKGSYISYGNNSFVACGNYVGYYSNDGINWTQFVCSLRHAVYANNLWVAVANNNNQSGILYSTDGITWTQSNITGGVFEDVCYHDGMWVACSNNYNNNPTGIYYSTDGKTWTQSNIATAIHTVHHADGIWLAGSNWGNSTGIYYSTDGMTWTQSNITSGNFNSFGSNNGMLIACGENGLYYSTDGAIWTQSNITSTSAYRAKNVNDIWVSTCGDGLYYSESMPTTI